jgi:crossover junction endodeoxyribonuclease RuvC
MAQTVLGIDPGLTRCGFGLVSSEGSRKVSFEEVGIFTSASTDPLEFRILEIGKNIAALLDRTKPDRVAIERVFSQLNLKTVVSVANISGVVVYLCAQRKIPITFYTPTEVKAAVTGSGRANKEQITNMVVKILKLKEIPKPADAADALAIAITGAWRAGEMSSKELTNAQRKWIEAEAASKKSKK